MDLLVLTSILFNPQEPLPVKVQVRTVLHRMYGARLRSGLGTEKPRCSAGWSQKRAGLLGSIKLSDQLPNERCFAGASASLENEARIRSCKEFANLANGE